MATGSLPQRVVAVVDVVVVVLDFFSSVPFLFLVLACCQKLTLFRFLLRSSLFLLCSHGRQRAVGT